MELDHTLALTLLIIVLIAVFSTILFSLLVPFKSLSSF